MIQVSPSPMQFLTLLLFPFLHTSLDSLHLVLLPFYQPIQCLPSQLDLIIFLKDNPSLLLCLEALFTLGISSARQLPGQKSDEEREVHWNSRRGHIWPLQLVKDKDVYLWEGTYLVSSRRQSGVCLGTYSSDLSPGRAFDSVPVRRSQKKHIIKLYSKGKDVWKIPCILNHL